MGELQDGVSVVIPEHNMACINRLVQFIEENSHDESDDTENGSMAMFLSSNTGTQDDPRRFGALVRAAVCLPETPLHLLSSLLQSYPQAALYKDGADRSPLHIALLQSDRPDIVQVLVAAAPETIHWRDYEGLLPIDTLNQKLIMKDELLRYQSIALSDCTDETVDKNWECARILALAHRSSACQSAPYPCYHRDMNEVKQQQEVPILHAILSAADGSIPYSMIERALRRYRAQLVKVDSQGNLPLHHVARHRLLDEGDNFLVSVLRGNPEAASVENNDGCLPFDLAVSAGRKWDTGVSHLLQAYPLALVRRRCAKSQLSSLPFILEALLARGCHSIVFVLLKASLNVNN